MTTHQAAYRAGAIAAELDARFGLTSGALNNACTLPNKLPAVLRHVWPKGLMVPEVAALLEDFAPPAGPYAAPEQGSFWVGYYHQKAARGLPADFPARLKAIREGAGMTPGQLAAAAGTTPAAVSRYESGDRRPTWDAVQQLAAALGVTTDTFRDRS